MENRAVMDVASGKPRRGGTGGIAVTAELADFSKQGRAASAWPLRWTACRWPKAWSIWRPAGMATSASCIG